MDRIIKATIFDKKARVTLISNTEAVNEAIKLHKLSPLATAALGRALSMGSYVGTNLKGKDNTFSITIKGDGPIGSIVVAGDSNNNVRGFVFNSNVDLPLKENGKLDVGGAVGKGTITVIKDLGLKKPYNGTCELKTGEIAEDFAFYLLKSEGIKSAVSFGVKVNKDGAAASGGIVVEALPGINDDMLYILEDIMMNFSNISTLLYEKEIEDIFDFYFGHLNSEILSCDKLYLKCNCSEERIKNMIKGLGKDEAMSIIKEQSKIEVCCQFCSKKYLYNKEDIENLWEI